MKAKLTVHLRIRGRVQGVYYRAWTVENAKVRRISGWVRHCSDGSVDAVFSSTPENVAELIELCRNGPRDASVKAIEIVQEVGLAPEGFELRPKIDIPAQATS